MHEPSILLSIELVCVYVCYENLRQTKDRSMMRSMLAGWHSQ